jgi:hypothetical protein
MGERKRSSFGSAINRKVSLKMNDKDIEVLQMIADDMKKDAARFDGQPFNGKTVAEYFGNQGAAIAALAQILKSDLQDRAAELLRAADQSEQNLTSLREEEIEDIVEELRDIHAEHCPRWDDSNVCNCSILQLMESLYKRASNSSRSAGG